MKRLFRRKLKMLNVLVRFLRAKSKDYHLNPDRIGVFGHSAGGHLAALLGTSGGVKEFEGTGG